MNKFFLNLTAILALTISASAQQWGDYTLYSVQNSTAAYLLDTNSNTFHSWTGLTGGTGYSAYLLSGGDLIRSINHNGNSFMGGGMTGEIQRVDYNGTLEWDFVYSTTAYCMHHDFCPMPNGNVLIISYEAKSASEAVAMGSSVNHIMWPDKIIEVQPTGATGGTIVWEWHSWDHTVQSVNNSLSNYGVILDHPELFNLNYNNTSQTSDWQHINGIDYNATLDQITFTSHSWNEIYVIDHSTTSAEAATHAGGNSGKGGDLLYRWGNPAAYGASGTTIFNTVHDAHWIPAGCPMANYLVGYNNNGVSMSQSSVDLISPPYNGFNYNHTAGAAYTPSTYTYRHACSGHNNNMGNSEQFPNGNMLVCIAQSGKMYEIDSNDNIIWTKTVTGTVPQAHRYTACYVSGTQPSAPTIEQIGGALSSSSGTTYQWYYNGTVITGATNQTHTPTQDGNYQVLITDASGCASDLSSAFSYLGNGIKALPVNAGYFTIFPNPSNGMVFINQNYFTESNYKATVLDAIGKKILQGENLKSLDLSSFSSGLYFVSIAIENGMTVNSKINLQK